MIRRLAAPLAVVALAWLAPAAVSTQTASPKPLVFAAHVIDTGLKGGYQSIVADMNRDGRPDVIGLASGLQELAWYENPGTVDGTWARHVMVTGIRASINAAAHDGDGDGIPEVALAADFSSVYGKSIGTVFLLTHKGDPAGLWDMKEIDRIPTAHRLRWVDMNGARKVLVNAPLIGPDSVAPDYKGSVGLHYYQAPDWKRQTITDAESGVVHGLWIAPFDGSRFDTVLTASFNGVFAHQYLNDRWTRTRVLAGDPAPWPQSGASDVAPGRLPGQRRFLTTIEPWHGTKVVVYTRSSEAWARQVIDEPLAYGHTIVTADFNGDGTDEIVAAGRNGPANVYLYRATTPEGTAWTRQLLDEGTMAGSGCATADINLDKKVDVVCIGSSTANLKWYENVTP